MFGGIQEIAADEALHEEVKRALRELHDKGKDCWLDWLTRSASREQQAFAERFQMRPLESPLKPAPQPGAAPAPQSAAAWESGLAWIARDPKIRATLYFISAPGRKPEERNRKDVTIDDRTLEEALCAAGPGTPAEVEGQRHGRKIASIRRPARQG